MEMRNKESSSPLPNSVPLSVFEAVHIVEMVFFGVLCWERELKQLLAAYRSPALLPTLVCAKHGADEQGRDYMESVCLLLVI